MRLLAFAAILVLVAGAAALAGAAIDPTEEGPVQHRDAEHATGGPDGPGPQRAADAGGGHGGHRAPAPGAGGLAVSQDGLTLETERTFLRADEPARFAFRISDARGQVLRDEFELESDREMHLIVVRRDTATYQHLHPRKHADGTWTTQLALPRPGVYRAYADFATDGRQRTLATDLFVPGDFRPERWPEPATADRADGLDVELRASGVRGGREAGLTFAVTRDGRPTEGLEPYLGAKGHLVALREGDLAYLHVHPVEGAGRHSSGNEHGHGHDGAGAGAAAHGNEIRFAATFPTAGRYRLFLQFRTAGEVRTVAYTLEVPR